MYNERRAICQACIHRDDSGKECDVPGTAPCCNKCGCSLALKLRSLSSGCGDENDPRWDAIITEDEENKLNETL